MSLRTVTLQIAFEQLKKRLADEAPEEEQRGDHGQCAGVVLAVGLAGDIHWSNV